MLPRQGREAPRRVQALLARTPTMLRVAVRALTMGRRDRLAATTLVPLARVASTPLSARRARRPCPLLTRPPASPTLSATTMLQRRHMMRRLLAAPTRHLRARLWLTLSARCLTLRRE